MPAIHSSATTARSPDRSATARDAMRIVVRELGRVDYRPTYEAMRRFTAERTPDTPDELWVLEHPPVYTVGLAGRAEHLPRGASAIPVEHINRGGQITYHGPGQAIVYVLLDLARRGLKVRELVDLLEQSAIDLLAAHAIAAESMSGAPGVYVGGAKIAALGLRVQRGASYHGLSFNVDMDLAPFADIDPCGMPGLPVTQAKTLGIADSTMDIGRRLAARLAQLIESRN